MAVEFKANISDPKTGKTYKTVVAGQHANSLVGKAVGDEFDGIFVGLPGYKLVLTGGSDKEGFPMRNDLGGTGRRKILVSKSQCFSAKLKQKKKKPVNTEPGRYPMMHGVRKRKSMRGNSISGDIIQLNMKIVSYGPRDISEMLKLKEEQLKTKEQKK